jgi:hypothetical protein
VFVFSANPEQPISLGSCLFGAVNDDVEPAVRRMNEECTDPLLINAQFFAGQFAFPRDRAAYSVSAWQVDYEQHLPSGNLCHHVFHSPRRERHAPADSSEYFTNTSRIVGIFNVSKDMAVPAIDDP